MKKYRSLKQMAHLFKGGFLEEGREGFFDSFKHSSKKLQVGQQRFVSFRSPLNHFVSQVQNIWHFSQHSIFIDIVPPAIYISYYRIFAVSRNKLRFPQMKRADKI